MLNILMMIIFIIIISILILLIIGVKISLTYNKKGDEIKGCLKIIILKKIKIYSLEFPSNNKEEFEKKDKNINTKKLLKLSKPCLKEIIKYVISILKKIKIKKIQNHIIFGKDSYADTGKYIGIIWAILSIINSIDKNIKISAEPSFNGSTLDGYGVNEVEINILKILYPTIKFLLKKDIRKLIRGAVDDRWNKKKNKY